MIARAATLSRSWVRANPHAFAAIVAALLAWTLGWLSTSPWLSMGINWDTAGYATDIGRGGAWASPPWDSHYGVGHVYWLMSHLLPLFGGTALDGIRAANAFALAWSAVALCMCARSLRVPPALAVLTACAYLTAWGTLLLAFTWEDNILVHPPALTALAICLHRMDSWRWRDSLYVGALIGVSSLMSWQGAAYAIPAAYAALVAGEQRGRWIRMRDTLFVAVGLAAMRAVWVLAFWLTATGLSLSRLLQVAFQRPSPNFLPESLAGWIALLKKPREMIVHAGIGVTQALGPGIRDMPTIADYYALLGAGLVASALLLWLMFCVVFRTKTGSRVRFLCAAFILLTAASIVYLDLPVDKYKRYDYIPVFAALGIVTFLSRVDSWLSWKRVRPCCLVLAGLLVAAQVSVGYRWNRQWYKERLMKDSTNYLGYKGQTWFSYIRSIRQQSPNSCSYVFAFHEVSNGRYQLEIPAALFSELKYAAVIGAPPAAFRWPRPLPLADLASFKRNLRGCEWSSEPAQALLGMPQTKP